MKIQAENIGDSGSNESMYTVTWGSIKARAMYGLAGGAAYIYQEVNVSSITDEATGEALFDLNTVLSNDDYPVAVSHPPGFTTGNHAVHTFLGDTKLTSRIQIQTGSPANGINGDYAEAAFAVGGILA